jgi:hypothetical protein
MMKSDGDVLVSQRDRRLGWLIDTLKIALYPSCRDTFWNSSGPTLDSPRDQQSRRIFAQSFCYFDHGGVIDNTV